MAHILTLSYPNVLLVQHGKLKELDLSIKAKPGLIYLRGNPTLDQVDKRRSLTIKNTLISLGYKCLDDFPYGQITGTVELVNCIRISPLTYTWQLANHKPLPEPVKYKVDSALVEIDTDPLS